MLITTTGVKWYFARVNLQTLTTDTGAFETAPVLGHETYDEQPVKTPLPVRAESEWLRNRLADESE